MNVSPAFSSTTAYWSLAKLTAPPDERGFPFQEVWRNDHWEPDPLVLEPLIEGVCEDLAELQPSLVVPAHCTGWGALRALARTFGPAYVLDRVGTRFTLQGAGRHTNALDTA